MKTLPSFLKDLVFYGDEAKGEDGLPYDDLKREAAFMEQALQACVRARQKITAAGLSFSRPPTISGSAFKTAEQIARAQNKLDAAAKELKAIEEARKQRALKQFSKKVQVERVQAKEQAIKVAKQRIGGKAKTGAVDSDEEDFAVAVEDAVARTGKPSRTPTRMGVSNAKRQYKDKKYGFGGKKRHAKQNDRASTDDGDGFDERKNKMPFKNIKSSRPQKRKPVSAVRPGKRRRQNERSRAASRKS